MIRSSRHSTAKRASALLSDPWIASGILLNLILTAWQSWSSGPDLILFPERVARGEALLHGLPVPAINRAMPLSSLLDSFAHIHAPSYLTPELSYLIMTGSLLLIFFLGRALYSNACGLLAAALTVHFDFLTAADGQEHAAYTLAFLLVASLIIRRLHEPNTFTSFLLGLSVGLSLLLRSPLILFPAALLAFEARLRLKKRRTSWPVWVLPLLLLLPWTFMNGTLYRRFIPLESGRATAGIVTGALGVVPSASNADFNAAFSLPRDASATYWALGEVLRHPLRYLLGYAARLWFFLRLNPVLVALGLLSLWIFRRREEYLQLGLLAGYFVVMHCFMGVLPRYFSPLWPIFAVLAAAVAVKGIGLPQEKTGSIPSRLLTAACLIPLSAAGAAAVCLAATYPNRLKNMAPTQADDPWQLGLRGRQRMRDGMTGSAVQDFSDALSLAPLAAREVDLAEALLVRGEGGADLIEKPLLQDPARPSRIYLLRAAGRLRRGLRPEAKSAITQARSTQADCRIERAATSREREVERMLCAKTNTLSEDLLAILEAWPADARAPVLRGLGDEPWASAPLLLETAALAVADGRRDDALRLLKRAQASDQEPGFLSRIVPLYARLGESTLAERTLADLTGPVTARVDARSWIHLANIAKSAGARSKVLSSLEKALSLSPDNGQIIEIASLYADSGEPERARKLIDERLSHTPNDPAFWIQKAILDFAEDPIDKALALRPTPALKLRIARLYQQRKQWEKALNILAPLTGDADIGAEALRDTGICEFLSGHPNQAAAALEAAIARDRGLLSAYLSLGTVQASQQQLRRAAETYDLALQMPHRTEDDEVRKLIRKEWERLVK